MPLKYKVIPLQLMAVIFFCLTLFIPWDVMGQTSKNYHRPRFRRQIYEDQWLRFAVDYDKSDVLSIEEVKDKIALCTTISKATEEACNDMSEIYKIEEKKLYGAFYSKTTFSIGKSGDTNLERNLYLKDDFYEMYLLGTEEWARRKVRDILVRKSAAEKYKYATNIFNKFVAASKRQHWPVIGLAALESEPWTPYKYSLLVDSLKHKTDLKPTQFAFFESMTNLEKEIGTQNAHAFSDWICDRFGKRVIATLIDKFVANPRSFWAIFKEATGYTGAQTYELYYKSVRDHIDKLALPSLPGKELVSERAIITRPVVSHQKDYIAFTSDYLSSRERKADLFICKSDGSEISYAATEAKGSLAWHEPTKGLFFIRDVTSAAGKEFNQLCWVPCTNPTRQTELRPGLKFSSLKRGTHFSEVAVSKDQSVVSVLRTRPGGCLLDIYSIDGRHRRSPDLKLIRTVPIGGVLHKWVSNESIVYLEVLRGRWQIVQQNILTGHRKVLEELYERVYDLDYAKDSNKLFYTIAWAHHNGMALREIDLSKPLSVASTARVIPLGGFNFSVTDNGEDLYYLGFRNGHFKILKTTPFPEDHTYRISQLEVQNSDSRTEELNQPRPDFVLSDTDLVASESGLVTSDEASLYKLESATSVNLSNTEYKDWNLSKLKLNMHTKVLVDFDTLNLSLIWKDELEQRIVEPTIWYDNDYQRISWEFRYSQNDSHPNWYVGLFDTTRDDFLNLFPLSKFTNEAFFKGATFGINHYLTARETLSLSLEMKDNIYEPEFFGEDPVPSDLRATSNMYRISYQWDTKEIESTDYIGSLGGRLVEISWADSPGFSDSDLKFTEALLDWREFIPIGRRSKDILAMRLIGGVRNQRSGFDYPVKFTLGGPDTLRGVQENSLEGTTFALATLEYRFKIFDRDRLVSKLGVLRDPSVSSLFFFDSFFVALFVDAAVASYDRISFGSDDQKGVGIEFRANANLTRWRPANLRLGFAHGTDSLGENTFYLTTGLNF
jgi:hypothetical protein